MDGWWCPPDMVVVAGPVPAGIYKKPANSLRLSVPKGAGLAREPRLVGGRGVLMTQPWSLRDCPLLAFVGRVAGLAGRGQLVQRPPRGRLVLLLGCVIQGL